MNLNAVRIWLAQIFILIEEHCSRREEIDQSKGKLMHINEFTRLIDRHYKNIKFPKDYAAMLNMTSNHLNSLCMTLVGKTAGELIRERLVLEAKRLLVNAKISSAEIAFQLGFESSSYFTQFFKKNTGLTPNSFRNEL